MQGRAPGICHRMKSTADAKQGTGRKRPELQCRVVQKPLRLGIGRLQNLKAVVQKEPFHDIGLDAAAHTVGGLQDKNFGVFSLKPVCAAQTGKARLYFGTIRNRAPLSTLRDGIPAVLAESISFCWRHSMKEHC
jgi:hypothetical protein